MSDVAISKFATTIADLSGKPETSYLRSRSSLPRLRRVQSSTTAKNLAAGDQEHYDHHVPDGVCPPEFAEPRRQGAQAKLDELILSSQAENKFVGIERLTSRSFAR
jgi:hypothetical protein